MPPPPPPHLPSFLTHTSIQLGSGEGAIHHRALWNCGKMPLTLFQLKKTYVSQIVNSKILERDRGQSTTGMFDAVVKCPPLSGGGGGAIHRRAFRSCGEKPPPYSSTPNQTPIISLEGGGCNPPQGILKLWTSVKCLLPPPSQSQNRSPSEGI